MTTSIDIALADVDSSRAKGDQAVYLRDHHHMERCRDEAGSLMIFGGTGGTGDKRPDTARRADLGLLARPGRHGPQQPYHV